MSQDVAILGKGCTLTVGVAPILGIRTLTFSPPGSAEPEKVDVTSHSSLTMLRDKIDGLTDLANGTLSFDCVWDQTETGHAALLAAYEAGTTVACSLLIVGKSGNLTVTFDGYVSKLEVQAPYDGPVTADIAITVDEDGIS